VVLALAVVDFALASLEEELAGAAESTESVVLLEPPVNADFVFEAPFFVAEAVAEAAFPVSEATVLPAVAAPLAVAFAAFFVFFATFVVVLVLALELELWLAVSCA
jgi:hypothetical protein